MGVIHEGARLIPGVAQAEIIGKTLLSPRRAGMAFGAVAIAASMFASEFSEEAHENVTAGHGEVTRVYSMDKLCYAGFETDMKDVKANYGITLKIGPFKTNHTGAGETITYNGKIENEVCHPGSDVHLYYKGDPEYKKNSACADREVGGKINPPKICAILDGPYEQTTYEKEPGKGYNMSHNGPFQMIGKNAINMINTVASVKGDGLEDNLRYLAAQSAMQTSSTSCLKTALPLVKKAETANLSKDITGWLNSAAGFYGAKPRLAANGSDVAVIDKSTVKGSTNQYTEQLKQVQSKNKDLHMQPGSAGKCTLSPALQSKLEKATTTPAASNVKAGAK